MVRVTWTVDMLIPGTDTIGSGESDAVHDDGDGDGGSGGGGQ